MKMRPTFVILLLLVAYHQTAYSYPSNKDSATREDPPPDKRYMLGVDSVRRDEAQKRCKTNGPLVRLAAIRNSTDKADLVDFIRKIEKFGDEFWIGGIFFDKTGCRGEPFKEECWIWDEDDEALEFLDPSLVPFTTDAYNHRPTRQSSLVIKSVNPVSVDHTGGSAILPYICDTEPSGPTPQPPCVKT